MAAAGDATLDWRPLRRSHGRRRICLLLLLATLLALPAAAQLDDDSSSAIQFNFNPPGARSLGLGGAFLAVADDATAAFTNPAGLVILREREVFAEVRQTNSSNVYVDRGAGTFTGTGARSRGTASGFGTDTIDNLQFAETDDEVTGLSFVSYVQPIGDFRFALYRHELVNFETSFESRGAFLNQPDGSPLGRLFPVQTDVDLDIEALGAAFAYKFSDRFSLGVGVSVYSFDVVALTNRFDIVTTDFRFFDPPNFAPGNVATAQSQFVGDGDDDEDVGFNAGLLWTPNSVFSLGAAYREGPEFDYTYTVAQTAQAQFKVPTVMGIGIAVRPIAALTISVDVNEVEYSRLVEDFTTLLEGNIPQQFDVDDATEVHLGLEYRFLNMANPITLRLGAWEDPAHQVQRNPNSQAPDLFIEGLQQLLWSAAATTDDETHVSAGIGFAFGENFSLDLAGDFSERVDIAALSAVVRF